MGTPGLSVLTGPVSFPGTEPREDLDVDVDRRAEMRNQQLVRAKIRGEERWPQVSHSSRHRMRPPLCLEDGVAREQPPSGFEADESHLMHQEL